MTKEEVETSRVEAEAKANKKAEELSEKLSTEVTPFMFFIGEEWIIGYIKNPDRLTKMRAIDIFDQSRTQAGDLVLRTSLIHDESDKRILEEKRKNDPIYLGAIDFAIRLVQIATEQLKKK